jgi:hypothetical protein
MNKQTLTRLGKLWQLESKLYNDSLKDPLNDDLKKKHTLVKKVKKNLEEQKRGFLKSKIPYSEMADYIVTNIHNMSFSNLHKNVCTIALKRA